jgi:hypothetical protein
MTKGPPFCHGSLHDPGLKGCLYIKAATLPLQHLATFSSPIRRHRRRRVLLHRYRHPPRPPPSAAPPVLCPPGFSVAADLPESAVHRPADALAPRHAARPPPSVLGTRPPSSRPASASGAPPPHLPRVGLLHILLHAVLPGLRCRRAPCRPTDLRVVASARASTSSPRPVASAFSLTVVLPNTGRGALPPPAAGVHRPCRAAPKF